jgi:hypothetical protein
MIVWVAQIRGADDEFAALRIFKSEESARKQVVRWINEFRSEKGEKRFNLANHAEAMEWFNTKIVGIDGDYIRYENYEVED